MSITVQYDGTTLRFDDAVAPDLPIRSQQASGIDKRRSFTGTYRQNVRYNKWIISMSFTGIDSLSSQQIRALVESDEIGTWTGFAPTISGLAGTIYGKVPVDSYSHAETGFNAFDAGFSVQEL